MYTIDDFWVPALRQERPLIPEGAIPLGWVGRSKRLSTFVEAPLNSTDEIEARDPCPIYLVSAPGAVGKSTLAREIAARTSGVLVDLAEADPVGAYTITGGLARSGLFDDFQKGKVALLIDGLDEARIRVTQGSFVAFLEDIYRLSGAKQKSITLFGRTSAIEDAWLHFAEMGMELPILEIQFHDRQAALEFVMCRIADTREAHGENAIAAADADERAANLILDSLAKQAQVDGKKFVGYAPVLIAVSKRIAAERNPMALVQDLEHGAEALALTHIVDAILDREKTKLERLEFSDPTLKERLYTTDEQIERLISTVYSIDHVPHLPEMSHSDAEAYADALSSWVPDHPFTDGTGKQASSEVFGGFIAAEALKRKWASASVRRMELGSAKVNPFIWDFRLPNCWIESDNVESETMPESIPLADMGIVFSSLQAQMSRLESAHLFIDADTDLDRQHHSHAEVEITRYFDGGMRLLRLRTDCDGAVNFGSRISDVNISGNELTVVLSGAEATIAAPVYLDVRNIDASHSAIVVEGPPHSTDHADPVVRLNCSEFNWKNDQLSVRTAVTLLVDWPGSETFPWRNHRRPDMPDEIDAELGECLRRLRKILLLFRARGMGQLAKSKRAINQDRRIRGSGAAVRDQLLEEGVLVDDGRIYVLDTGMLSDVLSLSFMDIRSGIVNDRTVQFLKRVRSRLAL